MQQYGHGMRSQQPMMNMNSMGGFQHGGMRGFGLMNLATEEQQLVDGGKIAEGVGSMVSGIGQGVGSIISGAYSELDQKKKNQKKNLATKKKQPTVKGKLAEGAGSILMMVNQFTLILYITKFKK